MSEQRKNYPMPEEDMYKISSLDKFIEKERRSDELDRMREVKQQKRVWKIVVTIIELIIVGLIILAYMGYKENA